MKPKNGIQQSLDWWETLSREDKSRWLQCAATPEEIDADLSSPDPEIRAGGGYRFRWRCMGRVSRDYDRIVAPTPSHGVMSRCAWKGFPAGV
jgi:hypothetical protein